MTRVSPLWEKWKWDLGASPPHLLLPWRRQEKRALPEFSRMMYRNFLKFFLKLIPPWCNNEE